MLGKHNLSTGGCCTQKRVWGIVGYIAVAFVTCKVCCGTVDCPSSKALSAERGFFYAWLFNSRYRLAAPKSTKKRSKKKAILVWICLNEG